MKVLEVSTLHAGIDQVLSNVRSQQEQLKQIEKSIQGFVQLKDSFKGLGGQAIRGYYTSYHLAFLQTLLAFYENYIEALERAKTDLNAFEPDANGFISESYLEHELATGLQRAKDTTVSLSDEANQIITSVSDIVSLPHLDPSYVSQSIIRAENQRDLTVGQLHTYDQQQTSTLQPLGDTVQAMIQYVQKVSSLFQARNGVTPTIESVYFRENVLQPMRASLSFLFSPSIQGKLMSLASFYLNYSQHTLTYKVEYVKNSVLKQNSEISEREIQALIRQTVDEVQVFEEFSTGTSEISGTYYVLPDGRILREYYKLNTSEASYTFVDYIPVKQNSCEAPTKEDLSSWEQVKETSGNIAVGTWDGLVQVWDDTVTGISDIVDHPKETVSNTVEAFKHPFQTFGAIGSAISESFERDVKNGDAYSRSHWFSYAVGTVGASVVGTKGLGAVGKTGVATTKSAVRTGVSATKNSIESFSIANLLPYTNRTQFAPAGVPFNVYNGVELKNQLISMARVESVGRGVDKDNIFSNGSFNHVFHGELNKKRKAVGYHHESMMGGKIVEVTDSPNKYGVYRAIVEIEGKNKKVPSTFFPIDWNRVQVTDAIKQAYSNRKVIKDNLYEGILPNGMKIQMRLDPEGKIKTAYPIY